MKKVFVLSPTIGLIIGLICGFVLGPIYFAYLSPFSGKDMLAQTFLSCGGCVVFIPFLPIIGSIILGLTGLILGLVVKKKYYK